MPNLMDASFLLTISKAGNLNTPFTVDGYPPHNSRLLERHGTAYRCVASECASCENSDVPLAWHNGPAFKPESSVVPIRPTEDPNDHQGSSWKEARLQTEEDAHEACSYASHLLLKVVFPRPLMAGNVEAPLDCLSFLGNPTEMLAVNTMSQLNMERGARHMVSVLRTLVAAIILNAENFHRMESERIHCQSGGTRESFLALPPPLETPVVCERVWLTQVVPLDLLSCDDYETLSCVGSLNASGTGSLEFSAFAGASISSTERATLYNKATFLAAALAGGYLAARTFGCIDVHGRARPRFETSMRDLRFSVGDFWSHRGAPPRPAIAVSWPEVVLNGFEKVHHKRTPRSDAYASCAEKWGFFLARAAMASANDMSLGFRAERWPHLTEATSQSKTVASFWCMGQEESDESLLAHDSKIYGFVERFLRGDSSQKAREEYVQCRRLAIEVFGEPVMPRRSHREAAFACHQTGTGSAAQAGDPQSLFACIGKRTFGFTEQCAYEAVSNTQDFSMLPSVGLTQPIPSAPFK